MVIILLLALVFALIAGVKHIKGSNKMKYPRSTNCAELTAGLSEEKLQYYAEMDKEATMKQHGAGYYKCYCKSKASLKALLNDMTNGDGKENICKQY